jgi:acyl-CoA reductase-like NAD-dependent aldehyde dehydrogenase
MRERELFIGGAWRAAKSGRRLEIHDPATGERVGSTALADAADVDLAVAAAKRALPGWAEMHADARASILRGAADLIVERIATIADLLTREQGRPVPDAEKEIRFGVEVIRYYAEEGRRLGGTIAPPRERIFGALWYRRRSASLARSRPGTTRSISMPGNWVPRSRLDVRSSSSRRMRRRSRLAWSRSALLMLACRPGS